MELFGGCTDKGRGRREEPDMAKSLCLLLKHEKMTESSALSVSVPSPVCLQLFHHLRLCLSLAHTQTRRAESSSGKRQDEGSH